LVGHYFSKPHKHNDPPPISSRDIPLPIPHRRLFYKIRMATPLQIGFLGAGKIATALATFFINPKLVKANQLFSPPPV